MIGNKISVRKRKRLTAQQRAALYMIGDGYLVNVQLLLGPNHPTWRWIKRNIGYWSDANLMAAYAKAALRQDDKQ